jgi:uncharacterized protein
MEKIRLKLKVSTGKPRFKVKFNEDEDLLLVEIKSNPEKGKANREIIKELKKYFKKEIEIVSGFKNKEKIVEINSSKKELLEQLS